MLASLHQHYPAWQAWKDELEKRGFREDVRSVPTVDVLHFREQSQWAAWGKLAEMEDSPEVDDYLRALAPQGMVYIPAGPFWMGSADDDPEAMENEKPRHEVRLRGYYIDRYPVTNAQYRAFIDAGGYRERQHWTEVGWNWKGSRTEPQYWQDANFNGDSQPVVGVSWYEAAAYAKWAGKVLPSEAEWEKAAGWDPVAKRQRRYPWGDQWQRGCCNTKEEGKGATTPVSAYSPQGDSAYGVAGLAGNVNEWCSTCWDNEQDQPYGYPYKAEDGRESLEQAGKEYRCFRSGSWADTGKGRWARCSFRV